MLLLKIFQNMTVDYYFVTPCGLSIFLFHNFLQEM